MANAEAWITGEYPNQKLNLKLPTGATGPQGPVGPVGPGSTVPGPATELTVLDTVTGPETAGATGPQGVKGDKGDPGGFVMGTDLNSATNLNSIVTPGLYRNWTNTAATTANNYPAGAVNCSCVIEVMTAASPTDIIQRVTPVNGTANGTGRLMFVRRYVASAWTAWTTYASTRIDQTAGRVIYQWDELNTREQLIYGDTGWRDIMASHAIAGATGFARIRRTGYQVELSLSMNVPTGTDMNAALVTLPAGFTPGAASSNQFYTARTSAALPLVTYGLTPTSFNLRNQTNWDNVWGETRLRLNWSTVDAWPTTLPGTAFGTIPNV